MSLPTLSIVIVAWNCKAFVEECLGSLRGRVPVPFEVIVIDNCSTDGTPELIEERFPDVLLIRSDENLGFARGNNLGIRRSRGRYLALINPDVKLLDGCLEHVVETLEGDDAIGMVGPAMLGSDGVVHRSGMRLPGIWNNLCDALALHRLFGPYRFVGGQMMRDFRWDTRRDVEVLNGWFWLVRRDAIDRVGLLDERFFMYGEDIDWCKRFRDAGWHLVFEPGARAIHYGGGSSKLAPLRFYLEMQRANLQYWRKHHHPVAVAAYRAVAAVHHAVRCVAFGLQALIPAHTQRSSVQKLARSASTLRLLALGRL